MAVFFTLKPKHRVVGRPVAGRGSSRAHAHWRRSQIGDRLLSSRQKPTSSPSRVGPVVIGHRVAIAAEAFLHGPLTLGDEVSINARVSMDGGSRPAFGSAKERASPRVRLYTRLITGSRPDRTIRSQPVRSRGIDIGGRCLDRRSGRESPMGFEIGDHAVVAHGRGGDASDVPDWTIVAGVPAAQDRRSPRSLKRASSGALAIQWRQSAGRRSVQARTMPAASPRNGRSRNDTRFHVCRKESCASKALWPRGVAVRAVVGPACHSRHVLRRALPRSSCLFVTLAVLTVASAACSSSGDGDDPGGGINNDAVYRAV